MRTQTLFTPSELDLYSHRKPLFDKEQIKLIGKKTPKNEIEVKTEGGFTHKSVKVGYVKAFVNLVTGGNYSFEIKSRDFIQASNEVIVEGRLTIWNKDKTVVSSREQFGQHYLRMKAATEGHSTKSYPADIGNGYKAAASDAFKKCASEFGFCWDIYGQETADKKKAAIPEASHADNKKLERLEHFLSNSTSIAEAEGCYNTYLDTAEETEASKALFKKYTESLYLNASEANN